MATLYSSLFGTDSTKGHLYGGFYTFLGGAFAGLASLVLYYVSTTYSTIPPSPIEFRWREVALVFGLVAGILIFYGISVTLPNKRGMRFAQTFGALLCLVALFGFILAYPVNFNVPNSNQDDFAMLIIGLYALGLTFVIAGTFTSLIGYYVGRAQAAAGTTSASSASMAGGDDYEVPDSVIEKDIEYAMKKYRYSWGEGGGSPSNTINVNLPDTFEGAVTVGGKGVARTVHLETPQVDDATKALRGIRPSREKSVSSEWTDDTTNALLQFRKQKSEQPKKFAPAARREGFWARVKRWLGMGPKQEALPAPSEKGAK